MHVAVVVCGKPKMSTLNPWQCWLKKGCRPVHCALNVKEQDLHLPDLRTNKWKTVTTPMQSDALTAIRSAGQQVFSSIQQQCCGFNCNIHQEGDLCYFRLIEAASCQVITFINLKQATSHATTAIHCWHTCANRIRASCVWLSQQINHVSLFGIVSIRMWFISQESATLQMIGYLSHVL